MISTTPARASSAYSSCSGGVNNRAIADTADSADTSTTDFAIGSVCTVHVTFS